jgi:CheY-like chemotaxis protein/HPt (histidine-containing phosphotransfer) domain-containing protein
VLSHEELKDVLSRSLAGQEEITVSRSPVRATQNALGGRKSHILLVEDNLTNQQVAVGILTNLGLSFDVADNGARAVQAVKSGTYDIVLMDVQMPVMDGYEATKAIRSYELEMRKEFGSSAAPFSAPPIIAMTAGAMSGDKEKCLESGMNDYISKPVSARALSSILAKWLPSEGEEPNAALPPIFDRGGMLDRLGGDAVLGRKVAAGFLQDCPKQIELLRKYLTGGDTTGSERQAHSIKSAAANVGGERLRAVAFTLEQSAHGEDLPSVLARMDELDAEFARLKQEMENREPTTRR